MSTDTPTPTGAPAPAATTAPADINAARRRRGLTLVAAAVVLAGLAWGGWHWFEGRHREDTDNAYVSGNVVQITPLVGGTVIEIGADDTERVRAGQTLARLDPADARVALAQAEAQLGETVREVRALFANNGALDAQVRLREADLARARAELARAEDDAARRAPLVASGAVGKEEYEHASAQLRSARSAAAAAESAVQAAREQLAASRTQTEGTSVAQHPRVQAAAAKVREAFLALQRTQLVSPVDGVVARRSVQLGQRVQAGTPLMAVVGLDQLWVDANFKENQLRDLRIGQRAEMEADLWGRKIVYHGRVVGLGAGTGAAFSLLPAQNATGNWIKIVQRVPVRISLDPKELAEHPLRVGLSMNVTVDTRDQSGPQLDPSAAKDAAARTPIYAAQDAAAEAEVARVLAASLGSAAKAR